LEITEPFGILGVSAGDILVEEETQGRVPGIHLHYPMPHSGIARNKGDGISGHRGKDSSNDPPFQRKSEAGAAVPPAQAGARGPTVVFGGRKMACLPAWTP